MILPVFVFILSVSPSFHHRLVVMYYAASRLWVSSTTSGIRDIISLMRSHTKGIGREKNKQGINSLMRKRPKLTDQGQCFVRLAPRDTEETRPVGRCCGERVHGWYSDALFKGHGKAVYSQTQLPEVMLVLLNILWIFKVTLSLQAGLSYELPQS